MREEFLTSEYSLSQVGKKGAAALCGSKRLMMLHFLATVRSFSDATAGDRHTQSGVWSDVVRMNVLTLREQFSVKCGSMCI